MFAILLVGACIGVLPSLVSGSLFVLFAGGLVYEYRGAGSIDWVTFKFFLIFWLPFAVPVLLAGFFLGRWAKGGEIEE
ncbi:hypothetical protein [Leisingera sp. F5]|uniref:hypothetical protein n=1 Tax=Leisingera sp. F5 TaxID=1813816 RepID=UPI0012EC536E|nr:hypothetical protein [Leisingera sp. F5]